MFFFNKKKKSVAGESNVDNFLRRFKETNLSSVPHALENGLVKELLSRAITEYNSGSYSQSITTLVFTLPKCDSEDDRAMICCFLALFYYDEANYDKAREFIDEAVALRPQFKSALNLMKRIYDIINECRGDKNANPDMIKFRFSGTINVSDLDIMMHNIDIESVRGLLDNVDRSQLDRKIELYRKFHSKKRASNIGSYKRRLEHILDDLEEYAPREIFTGTSKENVRLAQGRQAHIRSCAKDLCHAQKEVILKCVRDAGESASGEIRKKLLLFSTWHFYLALYARYETTHESGEFYHIIHRAMFPYAQEIEHCLKESFPDLNVAEEIGRSTKEFGAKLAKIIRTTIDAKEPAFDRVASDITWLFLDECGMEKSDPVSRKLYDRLYDFVVTSDPQSEAPQAAAS